MKISIKESPQVSDKSNKSISLVLSCGGARGLAHIGIIEVLQEHGYSIDSVSGSSIGAVIGGVFAAGKLADYKDWICSLKSNDVIKLMDLTLSSQGLLKGDKVFNTMKRFMSDVNIEDLNIPFVAVGTDLRRKKEVVFNRGKLYEAMRASVAVPGIITPLVMEGREVVDGGVLSPIPIEFAVRKAKDLLVISNMNAQNCQPKTRLINKNDSKAWSDKILNNSGNFNKNSNDKMKIHSIYYDSVSLMIDKISQLTIEKYNPDIIVNIEKDTCGMFEFHLAKELIQLGRDSCLESLSQIESSSQSEKHINLEYA